MTEGAPVSEPLTTYYGKRLSELIAWTRGARRETGKSVSRQAWEIAQALRYNPTFNVRSYYEYGLYREHGDLRSRCLELVGRKFSAQLSEILNPRGVSIAWDKLRYESFARSFGISVPETVALYRPSGRTPDHIPQRLMSNDDVVAFLRGAPYPMFAKPVHSQQGIGGAYLASFDRDADLIDVKGQGKITPQALIKRTLMLDSPHYQKKAGYLFQRALVQHESLVALTGSTAVSGLRVITLKTETSGAQVHRAVLKLIARGNTQDNFRQGRGGNLICDVDIATGTLGPAITGPWPGATHLTNHPDTGQPIVGFVIPRWQALVDEVCRVSNLVEEMRICHWDVVCGEHGPLFLELNDLGGLYLAQAAGRGFMSNDLAKLLLEQTCDRATHKTIATLARRVLNRA